MRTPFVVTFFQKKLVHVQSNWVLRSFMFAALFASCWSPETRTSLGAGFSYFLWTRNLRKHTLCSAYLCSVLAPGSFRVIPQSCNGDSDNLVTQTIPRWCAEPKDVPIPCGYSSARPNITSRYHLLAFLSVVVLTSSCYATCSWTKVCAFWRYMRTCYRLLGWFHKSRVQVWCQDISDFQTTSPCRLGKKSPGSPSRLSSGRAKNLTTRVSQSHKVAQLARSIESVRRMQRCTMLII